MPWKKITFTLDYWNDDAEVRKKKKKSIVFFTCFEMDKIKRVRKRKLDKGIRWNATDGSENFTFVVKDCEF